MIILYILQMVRWLAVRSLGQPQKFLDRTYRHRQAIRRTQPRRNREDVRPSPRLPALHHRPRRLNEDLAPATRTAPADALKASDTLFPSRYQRDENPRSCRRVLLADSTPA